MRNLERCIRLDTSTTHNALVSIETGMGEVKEKEVILKAQSYFKSALPFRYPAYYGNMKWPRPQNYAWQAVARHLDSCSNDRENAWLWWESDAAPEKPGWLDTLYAAYVKGKRPFLGHVVESGRYLNGVAIYPFALSEYSTDAFLVKDVPFDVQLSKSLRIGRADSMVCQRNDLIHHVIKGQGGQAPIVLTGDTSPSDTAVLCHGVTHVIESNGNVVEHPKTVEELPFPQQTRWPCGIYELSGNTKTIYFNPSLIELKGRDYLFTRRTRWVNPGVSKDALNDIAIFDVTESVPKLASIPKLASTYAGEQWDDPRAIVVDGKVYVSCAKWFAPVKRTTYQSLMVLSDDWAEASVFLEPKFGGNGTAVKLGARHEKNWVWFIHDGRWHCVYLTNPMTVYAMPEHGYRAQTFKNRAVMLPYQFGEPYGGTTPVLVGDEYVIFFHSFLPWIAPRRRYYMGAATFSAKPPFALKRICSKPILAGSEYDPHMYGGPPCIFPCGALLRGGQWLVTFGVNDENCGWIKIPHSELDALMKPIL